MKTGTLHRVVCHACRETLGSVEVAYEVNIPSSSNPNGLAEGFRLSPSSRGILDRLLAEHTEERCFARYSDIKHHDTLSRDGVCGCSRCGG